MYVRDARNRDEAWLLDHIESMGLDDVAFRSRDYVIAVDEESNGRAGFGRLRIHKVDAAAGSGDGDGEGDGDRDRGAGGEDDRENGGASGEEAEVEICELTGIGVLPAWRGQGVGAHVVERLVETAGDAGFDVVYSLTDEVAYLRQFGFETLAPEDLPRPLGDRLAEKRATVAEDVEPVAVGTDDFRMPSELRERFKSAAPTATADDGGDPAESPEDFGIDPESATYKYDTGG